jgi:hypothetical protein
MKRIEATTIPADGVHWRTLPAAALQAGLTIRDLALPKLASDPRLTRPSQP